MTFSRSDEQVHPGAGGDRWSFTLDHEGGLRLVVELLAAGAGPWHYRAVLHGDEAGDGDLVVLDDDEVPPPRAGSLEVRSHGLWAEHAIEVPFEQVGVGCEAFALRIDAPGDGPPPNAGRPLVGEPVAFGLDLGWETAGPVEPLDPGPGYGIACVVYGEILLGDARIAVEGSRGARTHRWGQVGVMRPFSEPGAFRR